MHTVTNASAGAVSHLRALRDTGAPLIAVNPTTKAPAFPGWREHRAGASDLDTWLDAQYSIGLRTGHYVALDIDVTQPAINAAIRDALRALLPSPITWRIGRAPKALIVCRLAAGAQPFRKMRVTLTRGDESVLNDDGKAAQIEILADGQQLVIHGIHPQTKQPYYYERGDARGGVELLDLGNAPVISEQWLREELGPALTDALRPLGITAPLHGGTAGDGARVADPDPTPEQLAALEAVVQQIANDARFNDRADYRLVIATIRAVGGLAALPIALEWAARWQGGTNEPAIVEADFRSLHPRADSRDIDYLKGLAGIVDEFDALPAANLSAQPVEAIALPSEGEQIAQLHGFADRALFAEVDSLPNGEIARRADVLDAAAEQPHPIGPRFASLVPKARQLRSFATEPAVFDAQLRMEMAASDANSAAQPLSAHEARLLRRAAWLLVAPASAITDTVTASPGVLAKPATAERHWIIDGLAAPGWLGAIVAPAGAGKTFIATHLAALVAGSECAWLGGNHQVRHGGSVLDCPSEDRPGVCERLDRYGASRVYVAERAIPLPSLVDSIRFVRDAHKQIPELDNYPLRLIIIDTLRGALGGAEENSNEVMAAAMRNAKTLARMTGAFVLVLHHTGHEGERARGGSAFTAELDVAFKIKKTDSNITLTVDRLKTGPDGEVMHFHIDESGVVQPGTAPVAAQTGIQEPDAHHVVRALHSISLNGAGATQTAVIEALAESVPSRFGGSVARSTRNDRARKALTDCFRRGWIEHRRNGRVALLAVPPDVLTPPLADIADVLGGAL